MARYGDTDLLHRLERVLRETPASDYLTDVALAVKVLLTRVRALEKALDDHGIYRD